MIFYEGFEKRLSDWIKLRNEIEHDVDPFQLAIDYWNKAPLSNLICDPFDKESWPEPWVLIENNRYCEFSKILAVYYTLLLTDRFKNSYFEIQIVNDLEAKEIRYLLVVEDIVIGYFYNKTIHYNELSTNMIVQASYPLFKEYS